jgi:hypothetical protein
MRFHLNETHESFSSSLMSRFRRVWWVARNLMKCDCLNRLWVALKWAHTSLDNSRTSIRHSIRRKWTYVIRWIETRQSKHWRWDQVRSRERIVINNFCMKKNLYRISRITSHMIKNESSQKISARENLNRIFQITFHIETRRKTRCQHILATNRLVNIHRNNELFFEKLTKSRKKKDCCERKSL